MLLFLVAPVVFTYLAYRYVKNKYHDSLLKYATLIPLLGFTYMVWTAIFPHESFYKTDYKEITRLQCTEEAKFLYKSASFPDPFGDYTSVFVMQTSPEAYNRLINHLPRIGFTETNRDNRYSPETKAALTAAKYKIARAFISAEEIGKSYYVAFLDDRRTILLRRASL